MPTPLRSLLAAALTLASTLSACSDETMTEPSVAEPSLAAPVQATAGDSWLTLANMPSARTDLATATVKNAAGQSIVYAMGGFTTAGRPASTVTAYNVATKHWTFVRPLPPAGGAEQRGRRNQRQDLPLWRVR